MTTSSSARPALPALTTIFTPPSYCTSTLIQYGTQSTTSLFGLAFVYSFHQCYPSSDTVGYTFSPGICPSGYVSINQVLNVWASTEVETEIRCCPKTLGMTSASTSSCQWTTSDSKILAPLIAARYQSTDTDVASAWSSILGIAFTSAITSPSPSSTVSSTLSTTGTASPSPDPGPPNPSELSAGAIAGIVIGVIVGFLLLLGALLLLLRRRKRNRTTTSTAHPVEERKWGDSDQTRWEQAGESRRM